MGAPDGPAVRSLTLRQTLSFLRPVAGRLSVTTLLGGGAAGSGVALLATSAWLISRAAQRPSVVDLGIAIVGVRFFAISRGLLRYSERVFGHDTALRVLADLRVRVYERLEALAPTGLPAFRRGDLLARLVQDVDAVQDLMLRVVVPYAVAILVAVPTAAVVWYVLPPAGLILSAGLLGGIFLVPVWSRALAHRREARLAVARGELSARVVDVLEGAADLVAFGALDEHLSRVTDVDADITRTSTATAQTAGIGSALITSLSGLVVWGILAVGVTAVHESRLQGPLLAVVVLTPLALFETVTGLPAAAQNLVRARRSAARVREVIDTAPPVSDPVAPHSLVPSLPTLRIRGLRARYGNRAEWALDGVDLDLPPGRRIGIVGASGAGKSSLAAVLLRFLPYEGGTVSLEGVELSELAGEDVRRVVGLAAQDTHVFDTTIRENLMLAKRGATEAEIRAVLARTRLLDWVKELPDGLDTEVGQHGARMSGGQRQRLGVARALLAQFPVLILDEPAEHLDTATADAITADLLDVTQGQSTLLISHRLRGMEELDEIVVLDAGMVIERGTHAELIHKNGTYARQWHRERAVEAAGLGFLGGAQTTAP
jgi:thiol reductant ABC exporter CydC subunit